MAEFAAQFAPQVAALSPAERAKFERHLRERTTEWYFDNDTNYDFVNATLEELIDLNPDDAAQMLDFLATGVWKI